MDYAALVARYDQLLSQVADPAYTNQLANLGAELAALEPQVKLARDLLVLDRQIQDNQTLLQDPTLSSLARSELESLQRRRAQLLKDLQNLTVLPDQGFDAQPAIIEFRPGTGGEEAKLWADDLIRMYLRFAQTQNLTVTPLSDQTYLFSGRPQSLPFAGCYGLLKWESGVHRVQRIPATEAQGRLHTSTASVAVLPKLDPAKITLKDEDLEWQFFRSGGKGGQNVNKVNTAVRLIHRPTGLTVVSSQERYQQRNREIALDLLRSQLWELEEEKRLATLTDSRRRAVGRAMRAEKIRTYNYPQNRVTDHRVHLSWHSLDTILEGDLKDLLTSLHSRLNQEV